jgi:xanthine dehydrogenase small subunit
VTRSSLRFILNADDVTLNDVPATRTLLDWLRLEQRLKGSKEGCAEGDCGACTVLIGRLRDGVLRYQGVNACIALMGGLDGAHIVTIEHLSGPGGKLHPVQQAMVETHGSQCGFCTPGIVMSLYALWMENPKPTQFDVETALQGNLCRCTGYSPIIKAAMQISSHGEPGADPLVAERAAMTARLEALKDGALLDMGAGRDRILVPQSVDQLAALYAAHPEATLVRGGTDVGLWITKFMRDIGPIIFIGEVPELNRITRTPDALHLGAAVSYADARAPMVELFPSLQPLWDRIGGAQVRNMGAVGANIANGSPIGDSPPPLIALGADIVLRHGDVRRRVKLEDFYIAYGKQDRQPGEFVEEVIVPTLKGGEQLACYKISKRRDEDISSLCGAFWLKLDAGRVADLRIAYGGMAATPKRARAVEQMLVGKVWSDASIEAALSAYATDYQPLTDMRASAEYRLVAARNLLRRFHLDTTGDGSSLSREAVA